MLTKSRRLNRERIPMIIKTGKYYDGQGVSLVLGREIHQQDSTFCLVVSSKIAKRAVVRNLIKRRGRHIIHDLLDSIIIGREMVFIFKSEITTMTFAQQQNTMVTLLKQAQLLKDKK